VLSRSTVSEPELCDVGGETRRCYLCKRDLPLEQFRTLNSTQRRGAKVYRYTGPSSDCRDCNREYKREQRRKRAEREGKPYTPQGDRAAWEAQRRADREQRKTDRRVAWAVCLAFRALVRPSEQERRRRKTANVVARQRHLYATDPDFQAKRQALKVKRKRAMDGTRVVPVNRERVAARDGWRCSLCGGVVTRADWSLDHVIPLSKGGEHTYGNVRLAHNNCNKRKGARMPDGGGVDIAGPSRPGAPHG
jgi:5-methylcytosine-specific restriction endonuclease McrA